MADASPSLLEQVRKFWTGLSRAKRVALVLVTSAVLIGVLAVGLVGSRVTYAPLYTGLNTEDSAAIAAKLKELKVPYRVTGTGIEVAEESVAELRLELASSGLPRGGGVGFEIFDSARFGATEFEQQVNLRRALEGELSRSIMTIQGVSAARVHLVLPERRLFAARSEGASASVVVKLQPGVEFGRREVAAVVHLVSSAVPGLTKERVSLVNTDGVTLHRPNSESNTPGSDEPQNQAARELATNMENHVRTLLERVTGPGGVDVRINVDLDEASRERTEEHYEPTRTALRSEHRTDETTTHEGTSVAGVPGAQTNLPDAEESVAARADEVGGNILRRTRTRNWEVDRITEKIVTPRGDVARVSAAVLIDGNYELKDGVRVYQPRPAEELARLEEVVKNAIGFSAARGDSIRVEGAKFSRLELPEPEPSKPLERYWPYIVAGIGALALAAVVFIGVRALRRARAAKAAEAGAVLGAAEQLEVLAASRTPGAALPGAAEPASGEAPQVPSADPALLEDQRLRAIDFATRDPAGAALILTRWLSAADEAASKPAGEGA